MNKRPPNTSPQNVWWFTDSKGRKIGWMWPEDFKRNIDAIWGERQGIGAFAEYSGMNRTTVETYCNGKAPVPKHMALLVEALLKLVKNWGEKTPTQSKIRHFPRLDADWLPEKTQEKREIGVARRPFS